MLDADTPFRLMGGLTRLPDVAFVRRENLPNGLTPTDTVTDLAPDIAPDLAFEVLSQGNTHGEMQRKRKEYFLSGTTQV